jgi:hypothetical protein
MVAMSDGSLFVAALDYEPATDAGASTTRVLLARIGTDGKPVWAERLAGCDVSAFPGMHPYEARLLSNGDVLVTGSVESGTQSFLMEVKPDGSIAWATSPHTDSGLSYLVIHSIRELPTTGFIAAGDYTHLYDDRRVFLAGFDSAGNSQWIKVYGIPLGVAGLTVDQGFPALALTDDGGAIIASYNNAPDPMNDAGIWMLEAAAKDGAITFNANAQSFDFPIVTQACTASPAKVTLSVEDFALAPVTFEPKTELVNVVTSRQAP